MGGCLGLVYGFLLPRFFSPLIGRKYQRRQKSKPCRKYSEGKQFVFVKNQFRKSSFFPKGNVSCGKFTQARHTYKLAGTPCTNNWKLETLVLVGGNVEKKEKINIWCVFECWKWICKINLESESENVPWSRAEWQCERVWGQYGDSTQLSAFRYFLWKVSPIHPLSEMLFHVDIYMRWCEKNILGFCLPAQKNKDPFQTIYTLGTFAMQRLIKYSK